MNFVNRTMQIRRELLYRLCSAAFQKNSDRAFDRIPLVMRPKESISSRCCLYKDRAILRSKLVAMLGFDPDTIDELVTLSELYNLQNSETTTEKPLLSVIGEACSMCNKSNYIVTNQCRGCVARTCEASCPKKAIRFVENRAEIDTALCINCGKCMQNCPYHAIIYQPIPCEEACPVGAIKGSDHDKHLIDEKLCISCGKCLNACPFGAVIENNQLLPLISTLQQKTPVVALIAPAIAGQFNCSLSQIKTALKQIGLLDVMEVAWGAEETIRQEGAEINSLLTDNPAQILTSSCCPSYRQLIAKHLPAHQAKVSHTQTPLYYTAQIARNRFPEAKLLFIGPCLAKKAEVRQNPWIDFAITFEELGAILIAKEIEAGLLPDEHCESKIPSAHARGFAASGGVATAILNYLSPAKRAGFKHEVINGLDRKNITKLKISLIKPTVNFLEVMACEGGCIGGPGTVVPVMLSLKKLNE